MKKLYIIGNYFDVNHGLKTQYTDFRNYLAESVEKDIIPIYGIPELCMLPDGETYVDYDKTIAFIVSILDGCIAFEKSNNSYSHKWEKLESYLGEQSFYDELSRCMEHIKIYSSDIHDRETINAIYNNEDNAASLRFVFSKIKELFADWVYNSLGSIPYLEYKPVFIDEIDKNAAFLSFNYTLTLEKLYDIPSNDVCHIHGTVNSKCDEIIFGHGNSDSLEFENDYWGIDFQFNDLKRDLLKDTTTPLMKNQAFFKSLSEIKDIYPYGFSFSDVDKVYIETICRNIPEKCKWHFCKYDWEHEHWKVDYISRLGFSTDDKTKW